MIRSLGGTLSRLGRGLRRRGGDRLDIAAMVTVPSERAAFEGLVAAFERAHPAVEVHLLLLHEDLYKASVGDWLRRGDFDILTGLAGSALTERAQAGLLAPLDGLWQERGLDAAFGPAAEAVRWRGRPWALPLSLTGWQFYYRRSVFAGLGLSPPQDWDGLLAVLERLGGAGLTPLALGLRERWPVGAWFDSLDLRVNGLAHHRALAGGGAPFDGPRVRTVLEHWNALRGTWGPDPLRLRLDQSVAELCSGGAGLAFLGSFAATMVWPELRGDIGCFPFPAIDPAAGRAEPAVCDVLVQPAAAAHPQAARRFLAFAARPEVQARYGAAQRKLCPHRAAPPPDDPLLQAQAAALAAAEGLTPTIDLALPPAVGAGVVEALLGFVSGGDIDVTTAALQAARGGRAGA
ncbi:MAG TPA: extracellular solute-binding protein [Alphaproteobacteria bacterium]|nr:extracellular solute-binding protein [Alphaproteobacteria bacterium]